MIYKIIKTIKRVIASSLFFKGATSFFDQGLLSALNFLVGIILIKTVSQHQYGYHSIAWSVLFFIVSIQNAIVTTPLTVLLASKKDKLRHDYVSGLYKGQFLILLPVVAIVIGIISILYSLGLDRIKASVSICLSLLCAGFLSREFLRSYCFAKESVLDVLKIDLCYIIIYFTLIVITLLYFNLSVSKNFIFIGLSAAIVFVLFKTGFSLNADLNIMKQSYYENWKYGKWALLGVVVTHIQSYSYLYLVGAFIGSIAVAEVSASRLLLMPLALLQGSWGKVAIPNGARLRESNRIKHFFMQQMAVSAIMIIMHALYVSLISITSGFLQNSLFTEKYENAFEYIILWGCIFAIHSISVNASYGLQVTKQFRSMANLNLITMIITLTLCFFLMKNYGVKGALFGLFLGHTSFAIPSWALFFAGAFSKSENREVIHRVPKKSSLNVITRR